MSGVHIGTLLLMIDVVSAATHHGSKVFGNEHHNEPNTRNVMGSLRANDRALPLPLRN